MKGIVFAVLFVMVPFALVAQAQPGGLVEVRGVETRWARYTLGSSINISNRTYSHAWGFEFRNMNNFQVTVDAELIRVLFTTGMYNRFRYPSETIANTISLVLDPGEEFIWRLYFSAFNPGSGARGAFYRNPATNAITSIGHAGDFYVRFRVFRFQ